jgi:hypothetical protein
MTEKKKFSLIHNNDFNKNIWKISAFEPNKLNNLDTVTDMKDDRT